ncbi:MAG: NAD(P)H-binding protein [Pseudomonadota bacterium]
MVRKTQQCILLAGATGYIGRHVAARLIDAGYTVVAISRSADTRIAGCRVITVDITQADALQNALAGEQFDAIVSCIASRNGAPHDAWLVDHDANQHLLAAGQAAGARHFVLLSAICVQRPRLAFQQAKLAFETSLMNSGLRYSIVRPTAFFKSLSGQIARVTAGKPFLVFGDGRQTACKPISEQDLAQFIVDCLTDTDKHNQILPIGGPGDAITAREQGELLFSLVGREPRFRQIPPVMFRVVAALLVPAGKLIPAIAAKAEFARIGHYYATESMLVWNAAEHRYDAAATPSTGSQTLTEHYRRILSDGIAGHDAGDHKLF